MTVTLEDDLAGGPADEAVRFAVDGSEYEIDLNAKNAAAFGKLLAPCMGTLARPGGRRPARRAAASRRRSGDIRAWAKKHGLVVSERAHPGQRGGAA